MAHKIWPQHLPTTLHLSVSFYLTETYLIGSMKVLMGLKQKFSKRSCQWKFSSAGMWNESLIFMCSFPIFSLCRSLSCPAKYAKYLESYSVEGVRHIFKKACTIHLPKKPTVHLLWAAFEEQQGKISHMLSNWKHCVFHNISQVYGLKCAETFIDPPYS